MNQDKINMINTYIKSNVVPVLVEGLSKENIPNSVIIPATCDVNLLNGHYEGIEFVAPPWYNELISKENNPYNVLIIDDITSIDMSEQLKFVEILKYKKISTFDLPKNCCIVILAKKNINKTKIHPEIYSLVAHI